MSHKTQKRLERLQSSLDSDHLLDAIHTFLEAAKEIKEARLASSLPDAKHLIECGLIRGLTEIALQAARIVKWTKEADMLCDKLREMRDGQALMELVYHNQHKREMRIRQAQGVTDPPEEGSFELEKLSEFNPEIYWLFLNNLNNLITLYEHFQVRPLISIATQAILIGKQACALVNILYILINLKTRADAARMLCHYFTHRILLSPILRDFDDLICRVHCTHTIREQVWGHVSMQGYTDQDLDLFREYALFVVDDPFPSNDGDEICAYAILNHDVMEKFPSPNPDGVLRCVTECEEDFKQPIVVIKYLFVRAPYRRCGFGGALVKYITKMAKVNGYQVVSIEETDAMLESRIFWNAMKFQPSPFCQGWHEMAFDSDSGSSHRVTPAST